MAKSATGDALLLDEMPVSAAVRLAEPPKPAITKPRLYVFELVKKVKPRGPDAAPFTPYKTLSAEQTVYDEKTGRERTLRYLKGINTFWVDEQAALELSDQFINNVNNLWVPEFKEGKLFLTAPQDQSKIDCLMSREDYEDKNLKLNPGQTPVFRWANQAVKSNMDMELRKLRKKATDLALSAPYEELLAHASYLGVGFKDMYQQDKNPDDIRSEYFDRADKEPKLFLETYSSPLVKFRFNVKAALESGKVDLNYVKGEAHWANTKALIKVLDADKIPIADLTDFGFTQEGNVFYKEISKS